ncbi:MAG: ABC transporter ATP-binding protein [Acidobacteriota bacterium]
MPPQLAPILKVDQLTKRFGSLTAVWKVNLEIHRGDFWVIFGPNGAGKSTLLKTLAQLTHPSEGTIDFLDPAEGRGRIGYVSHQSLLYGELTGLENLVFFARLYGLDDPTGRALELLEQLRLTGARNRQTRGYSSGMKQRLTLARALLHNPGLLLLDEPYAGLDQHGSRLLTDVLLEVKREGRTVLMITHNLSAGLALSSHVMIMSRGQAVYRSARSEIDDSSFEGLYFQLVEG